MMLAMVMAKTALRGVRRPVVEVGCGGDSVGCRWVGGDDTSGFYLGGCTETHISIW